MWWTPYDPKYIWTEICLRQGNHFKYLGFDISYDFIEILKINILSRMCRMRTLHRNYRKATHLKYHKTMGVPEFKGVTHERLGKVMKPVNEVLSIS